MVHDNNIQEVYGSKKISFLRRLMKRITGEVTHTEEEIEAKRKDYWKCPGCNELSDLNEFICWKCDKSRPDQFEHPGKEDVRRVLQKENQSAPFWAGLVFFIGCGGILLRGYVRYHTDPFPDLLTILFAGFFALCGVVVIIYGFGRKIKLRRSGEE
jgi:hypothetical protein